MFNINGKTNIIECASVSEAKKEALNLVHNLASVMDKWIDESIQSGPQKVERTEEDIRKLLPASKQHFTLEQAKEYIRIRHPEMAEEKKMVWPSIRISDTEVYGKGYISFCDSTKPFEGLKKGEKARGFKLSGVGEIGRVEGLYWMFRIGTDPLPKEARKTVNVVRQGKDGAEKEFIDVVCRAVFNPNPNQGEHFGCPKLPQEWAKDGFCDSCKFRPGVGSAETRATIAQKEKCNLYTLLPVMLIGELSGKVCIIGPVMWEICGTWGYELMKTALFGPRTENKWFKIGAIRGTKSKGNNLVVVDDPEYEALQESQERLEDCVTISAAYRRLLELVAGPMFKKPTTAPAPQKPVSEEPETQEEGFTGELD